MSVFTAFFGVVTVVLTPFSCTGFFFSSLNDCVYMDMFVFLLCHLAEATPVQVVSSWQKPG